MTPFSKLPGVVSVQLGLAAVAAGALLIGLGTLASAVPASVDVLRIGTSGTLASSAGAKREMAAIDTLREFIKTETGFNNEILRQKDWSELATKLAQGHLHLGVFQGFEFAQAQEKNPELKALALAVNVYRYPTVHVVAHRDDQATTFEGLQGRTLALPEGSGAHVRLFLDRQSQATGKKSETFFAQILGADSVEDALDDLVDGKVHATATDLSALDAYKRRKPGRYSQLKEIVRSQPFPPAIVAYQPGVLDEAALLRFRQGLLRAGETNRGQTFLTLFRLTGFEAVPLDLDRVLAESRKSYPSLNELE